MPSTVFPDPCSAKHCIKKRIDVENVSTVSFKLKIHQIFLVLIGFWMIYAWYMNILFAIPRPEIKAYSSDELPYAGSYIDKFVQKTFSYATIFFVQFFSDAYNLTLLMMFLISRIVLNFVTLRFSITWRDIHCGYEIDDSYFVPSQPEPIPMNV